MGLSLPTLLKFAQGVSHIPLGTALAPPENIFNIKNITTETIFFPCKGEQFTKQDAITQTVFRIFYAWKLKDIARLTGYANLALGAVNFAWAVYTYRNPEILPKEGPNKDTPPPTPKDEFEKALVRVMSGVCDLWMKHLNLYVGVLLLGLTFYSYFTRPVSQVNVAGSNSQTNVANLSYTNEYLKGVERIFNWIADKGMQRYLMNTQIPSFASFQPPIPLPKELPMELIFVVNPSKVLDYNRELFKRDEKSPLKLDSECLIQKVVTKVLDTFYYPPKDKSNPPQTWWAWTRSWFSRRPAEPKPEQKT